MRLVATDIDGTILPHSTGVVSARTSAALRACKQAGTPVVFVTGRPPRWIPPIVDDTGHDGVAICANGAVVWDAARNEVISDTVIAQSAVRAVENAFRTAVGAELADYVGFAIETVDGFRHEVRYPRRDNHPTPVDYNTGDHIAELLYDNPRIIKMLVSSTVLNSDELLTVARESISELVSPSHSTPDGSILELAPLGVTKARTLAQLAGDWGIDAADVISFGDMPNDVEMLQWTGRSWAMRDGHPEAIAAADNIAPAAVEDGVAAVLESLLGSR